MKFLFLAALASASLRHAVRAGQEFLTRADPLCKMGIASTDQYACCPKSCGSCDDANDVCSGGGDLADKSQGGCCPSYVKGNSPSCDSRSPPCVLGDDYRNPPNADLSKLLSAEGDRNAKDDCNHVVGETQKESQTVTHFVLKTGIKVTEPGFECGTYGEVNDALEACRVSEKCVGVSLAGEKPDCLLSDFGLTSTDTEGKLYLKVKNQAGKNLPDGQVRFGAPADQELAVKGAEHAAHVAEDMLATMKSKMTEPEPKAIEAAEGAVKSAKAAAKAAEAAPDAAAAVKAEEDAVAAEGDAAGASVDAGLETLIFATGTLGDVDIGKDDFNKLAAKTGVLKRVCDDCEDSHKLIYYKRNTNIEGFNYYDNMLIVWESKENSLHSDIDLYSSLDNLKAGHAPWTSCNYDDFPSQIGFPRDCGPTGGKAWQWTSFKHGGTKKNYAYYVVPRPQDPFKCISKGKKKAAINMPHYNAESCAARASDAKFAGSSGRGEYKGGWGECLKTGGGSYTYDDQGLCPQ